MRKFLSIFVLVSLFALTSCNRTPDGEISWQPNSLDLTPPPGPPEYKQGWSDGCESGANAYASNVYKMFKAFEFKFDAKLRNDKVYYQVWKDAFLYCSIYWERTQTENI
jgi:hypothetical protein